MCGAVQAWIVRDPREKCAAMMRIARDRRTVEVVMPIQPSKGSGPAAEPSTDVFVDGDRSPDSPTIRPEDPPKIAKTIDPVQGL
jgi:hypothetical protein